MLDWINLILQSFGRFVALLFQLPIYKDLTVGYFLVAVAVFFLVFQLIFRRFV